MKSATEYKELTIKEFSKAADIYETGHAGIYEMCKDDYPYISEELKIDKLEAGKKFRLHLVARK